MRRRFFVLGAGAAAMTWRIARSEPPTAVKRIGWLSPGGPDDPHIKEAVGLFLSKLKTLGWTQDAIAFYARYAQDPGQYLSAAAELVAIKPDVLVAFGGTSLGAFKNETRIPIVFTGATDPVGQGLISSLGHPGGNITGFSIFDATIANKWLGIFKQLVPNLGHAICIFNPATALTADYYIGALRAAGSSMKIEVEGVPVHNDAEIASVVGNAARDQNNGLIALPDGFLISHVGRLIAEAASARVPAFYFIAGQVAQGGLVSYAQDQNEETEGAAVYVDQILRGKSPGDLPVQGPSHYQLAINLKTAKALGLAVPAGLIASADQVIE